MDNPVVSLAKVSLFEPRAAAQTIIDMGLSREVLWTALALVAVVNTFLVALVVQTSAPTMPLPGYFERPLALFILIAGLLVVYIHAMYWAGLTIGGQGALLDVLALVVWFQVLRATAQATIIVVSFLVPPAGLLLSLVVAVWGVWIILNFLAVALNLKTPWHSIAVLLVAFIGLVLGFALLLALLGGLTQGVLS